MTDQSLPHSPAEVPDEIDRWNWGAFLLNWIWGIGNNTRWNGSTLTARFLNQPQSRCALRRGHAA